MTSADFGPERGVPTIAVTELECTLQFSFDDTALRYAGPGSPGGVAIGFKALQRAFAVLSPEGPPERRTVTIRTAFRGPGAGDTAEAVTRAVTDGRYTVDRTMLRTDRGQAIRGYVGAAVLARVPRRIARNHTRRAWPEREERVTRIEEWLGAVGDERVGALGGRVSARPGHGEHRAAVVKGASAVIGAPPRAVASTTTTTSASAAMMRLRTGERLAAWLHAVGELAHQQSVLAHTREQGAVTPRVDDVEPGTEHTGRDASGVDGALVRGGVDPIASPLTTVMPAPASTAPISRASASPCRVAARVPTTATRGR